MNKLYTCFLRFKVLVGSGWGKCMGTLDLCLSWIRGCLSRLVGSLQNCDLPHVEETEGRKKPFTARRCIHAMRTAPCDIQKGRSRQLPECC